MRFIYGLLLGVIVSVIGSILYLAFGDGEYLLQLSPRYHDMSSTIGGLKEAKEQRDQLAGRLESLANSFNELTRKFNELREAGCEPTHPATPPAEQAPKAAESAPPKTRGEAAPAPLPPP